MAMQARNLPIARDYHALRAIKTRGVEAVSKAAINSLGSTLITALLVICVTILVATNHAVPESLSGSVYLMVGYMGGSAITETVKSARSGPQGGTNGG